MTCIPHSASSVSVSCQKYVSIFLSTMYFIKPTVLGKSCQCHFWADFENILIDKHSMLQNIFKPQAPVPAVKFTP